MKTYPMDVRLSKTLFNSDDTHPHIVIDPLQCVDCPDDHACAYNCSAERYTWDEENKKLVFDHVGCLECGNCRLVCSRLYEGAEGYSWNYPKQAMGVVYREG